MQFCKEYNAATQDKIGTIIPVEIAVYEDRSFTFILKTPPASVLLKKAAGVESGSGEPNRKKVGSVTLDQVKVRRGGSEEEGERAGWVDGGWAGMDGWVGRWALEAGRGVFPGPHALRRVVEERGPQASPAPGAGSAQEIAAIKLPDLNCTTIEAAMETIKGTARNMGIDVEIA